MNDQVSNVLHDVAKGLRELHRLLGTSHENLSLAAKLVDGMAATLEDRVKEAVKPSIYRFTLKQWLPQYAEIEVEAADLEEATTKAILIAQGKVESGWQWRSAYDHEHEARDFVLATVTVPGGTDVALNTPVYDAEEQ